MKARATNYKLTNSLQKRVHTKDEETPEFPIRLVAKVYILSGNRTRSEAKGPPANV